MCSRQFFNSNSGTSLSHTKLNMCRKKEKENRKHAPATASAVTYLLMTGQQ